MRAKIAYIMSARARRRPLHLAARGQLTPLPSPALPLAPPLYPLPPLGGTGLGGQESSSLGPPAG